MPPEKLKLLQDTVKLVTDSLSKKDFIDAFSAVIKIVRDLEATNKGQFKALFEQVGAFEERLSRDNTSSLASLKDQLDKSVASKIKQIDQKLASVRDGKKGDKGDRGERGPEGKKGKDGKDGRDGKDGKPGPKGESGGTTTIGWGAHPLKVSQDGVVKDKVTRHISFKGTGVSSVTRRSDGVVEVNITGPATFVDSEVPAGAVNGVNVTYTLSQTPSSGSLHLYLNGLRQKVSDDYSLSGGTITMVDAPSIGDSLLTDFRY